MSEEELDRIVDIMRRLTPRQLAIILGEFAVLQAFDDDDAADRWLERNLDAIVDQVKEAGS